MLKRILIAIALLTLLVGCVGLTWQPAITPAPPPAANTFSAPAIALGAQLAAAAAAAAAGNCAGCHSVAGGPAWGGGLGLETGFGMVYGTNISPDLQTGIGGWPQAAFARAMHEGVARDGQHLLPAFPYTHFTKLSSEDVGALYAFFMTQPAVVAANRANTLKFPDTVRALQAGWMLLFFEPGGYQNVADKSASWNRGAYLSEGIAHCAACHTPRNRFGAERTDARYAGAAFEGWWAPALNADIPAPLPWTQQDLYDYLRSGESNRHGAAAGAMADVVNELMPTSSAKAN